MGKYLPETGKVMYTLLYSKWRAQGPTVEHVELGVTWQPGWEGLGRMDTCIGWEGLGRMDTCIGWEGLGRMDTCVGWEGLGRMDTCMGWPSLFMLFP